MIEGKSFYIGEIGVDSINRLEKRQPGFVTDGLYKEEQLAAFQQAATELDVVITVLAGAGEAYSHRDTDAQTGRPTVHNGVVPLGSVHIRFVAKTNDLGAYWSRVHEITAQESGK